MTILLKNIKIAEKILLIFKVSKKIWEINFQKLYGFSLDEQFIY
jgi:hypothetical protein